MSMNWRLFSFIHLIFSGFKSTVNDKIVFGKFDKYGVAHIMSEDHTNHHCRYDALKKLLFKLRIIHDSSPKQLKLEILCSLTFMEPKVL